MPRPIPPTTYDQQLRTQLYEAKGAAATVSDADPSLEIERQRRRDDRITTLAARVEHMAASGAGVSSRDLERYLGRNDLLRVNYLTRGVLAARPVCRIRVAAIVGGGGDWGTGFLVSPRLLLTNHHVVSTLDDALRATAEFEYEADASGRLRSGTLFRLAPDAAFIADPELDFTLVALAERSEDERRAADEYGFLRLDPNLHKVDESEFVTIIQHPNGDEKCIAIRENEVLKIGDPDRPEMDNWLWYASDTAPGSSGAPAFNDQWQVVAVHRRGVPERREQDGAVEYRLVSGEWVAREIAEDLPEDRVRWLANEGIRTSKILAAIRRAHALPAGGRFPLVQAFLDDVDGVRTIAGTTPRESIVPGGRGAETGAAFGDGDTLERRRRRPRRNLRPARFYDGRTGYDPDFLGVTVPLPALTERARRFGDPAPVAGTDDHVLRYTHFSVVLNAGRRLAFYTAVNIDGSRWLNLERGDDVWYYDPRLPLEVQIGDELYGNEPGGPAGKGWFDRGHLVRRLDPVWGTLDVASLANDDTFHWTNAAPQYWGFNQGQDLWQGLENFILYNTDEENVRACVFTGPIFQDDDEEHRGVLIPRYFWKVVAVTDGAGALYTSAYVVSQERYARNVPFERLPVGAFNNFQVRVASVARLTGLDFGDAVLAADVLPADADDRPLRGFGDIVHPRRGHGR